MARRKPGLINGQFIAHRVEMLESPAWAALSFAARRALDRLEIEHAHHGGKDNGRLACTYDDFERFGLRRKSISEAIRQLVACGFVEVTERGSGGNREFRRPARYRLTYLGTKTAAPTDDWRSYRTQDGIGPCPLVGRAGRPVRVVHLPRDIESRGANATELVGAISPPKRSPVSGEIAPDTRGANAPGLLNFQRRIRT